MTESPHQRPSAGDSAASGDQEPASESSRRGPDLNSPNVRRRWALEEAQLRQDLREARAGRIRRTLWICLVAFFCLDIVIALWLSTARL